MLGPAVNRSQNRRFGASKPRVASLLQGGYKSVKTLLEFQWCKEHRRSVKGIFSEIFCGK